MLPLGDLLTVHTCDGAFEVPASSCLLDGTVIVIMITVEMKHEAQLGGQPGLVVDYTQCNRRSTRSRAVQPAFHEVTLH